MLSYHQLLAINNLMTDDGIKTLISSGSGCCHGAWVVIAFAIGAVVANSPAYAVPSGAVLPPSQHVSAAKSAHVQLADARRYRHCHGRKRCHGRGEYYRYTPTPYVYVPRFYAPYGHGYGGGYYGYGGGWGYGGFGGHHGSHHFRGHHSGHHSGHH